MMKERVFEVLLAAGGAALLMAGVIGHVQAMAARTHASSEPRKNTFAVVGARVFDGNSVLERATVLVEAGVIKQVAPGLAVPKGIPVVDGAGKTLLPGLIDAHTHVFGDALERALVFGVTTELDMFTDARFAAARREEQRRGVVTTRADLVSAGTLVTAASGHGTEYGIPIPTIGRASEAQAFVDARIAEGSDYIKIIYDDLASYAEPDARPAANHRASALRITPRPTVDRATLAAVVAAAHLRHKIAIVHVGTRQAARDAVESGADGLAHVFSDEPIDQPLVDLARERHVFVVPTLAVIASMAGRADLPRALASDPNLAPYVGATERGTLNASFGAGRPPSQRLEHARATVAALRAAGVSLLAGTDAPNPGTAHGVSLHEELQLLVGAGLSPAEALAAATSVPAKLFHLEDRGRVAPGLRADLLLTDGDPTRDITATRRIACVWKGGVLVERRTSPPEPAAGAPVTGDGLVSDFETDTSAAFGSGWMISTDKMMGGASEAEMRVVADGAAPSRGSLEVAGQMKPGSPFPWAGAMFFPGPQPMAAADLSRFKTLSFWARGDGGSYRVMVFATRLGRIPAEQRFVAGSEWQEVVMPLSTFGSDGSDLQGILFSGSADRADFRFQIDRVRFR